MPIENHQASNPAAKIALGSAQFGMNYGLSNQTGQVTEGEASEILRRAREAGVDMIDTAQAYGESERVLGRVADGDWRIYTKLPPVPAELLADGGAVRAWFADRTAESLDRLGLKSVAGLMLHQSRQLTEEGGEHIFAALREQRDAGRTGEIGISIYSPDELAALGPDMRFDFVQGPLNILDMRLAQSGWLARLADDGCAFFARSAFLQGLLLMAPEARPAKFQEWAPLWRSWERYQAETGLSPVAACIRHLLRTPHVDRIILGVTGVNEFVEILDSLEGELPPLPADFRTSDTRLIDPTSWPSL